MIANPLVFIRGLFLVLAICATVQVVADLVDRKLPNPIAVGFQAGMIAAFCILMGWLG